MLTSSPTTWLRPLLLLVLTTLLAACSFSDNPPLPTSGPTPTTAPPTAVVERGGNLTIRLAADIDQLQPWAPNSLGEEQLVSVLYRGLTKLDRNLQPQPDIASDWQIDGLGRTITMTLRTDAVWHDGAPLTSEDAQWTIETLRAISPTTTLLSDLSRVIGAVHAPNASTLVLQLNEPYAPLLSELSLPILPRHIFEGRTPEQIAASDFWERPVGSGPFQFDSREAGQAIVLTRFERFYGGAPYLDRVAFVVAPDAEVAEQALYDGELLVAEMPWYLTEAISKTAAGSGLRVGMYPENGFYFLGFNLREGRLFSDPRLREALTLAIDVPQVVQAATGERGIPLGGDLLPGTWAGESPPPASARDLNRANELLVEAGWLLPEGQEIRARDGITLTAQLYVRADDERRLAAAQSLAGQARRIGMDLQVTPADFETTYRSKFAPPFDFDLLLGSWFNSRIDPARASFAAYDPDNFALFHSSQIYQGPADARPGLRNVVGFNNENFDNQSTAARSLFDFAQRRDLYQQMEQTLAEERPYLFLWTDRQPVIFSTDLRSTTGEIEINTPMYLSGIESWYVEE